VDAGERHGFAALERQTCSHGAGQGAGFCPVCRDAAAIRAQVGQQAIENLLERARADIGAPIPALPATLYREFARTGQREGYEDAQRDRRTMLYRLTLAEWLEQSGEFVEAAENLIWARLEETNWPWPAHARTLDLPDRPTVDLAAAMSGLDLAEADYLLGDKLSPELRARIRSETNRRTIAPFLERNDHWWLHTTPAKQVNNWTAVCVGPGVVGAACYFEADLAIGCPRSSRGGCIAWPIISRHSTARAARPRGPITGLMALAIMWFWRIC
jgi:hypothetical protein